MVQIPANAEAIISTHENAGAKYLQQLVNFGAEKGWEFYRVDTLGQLPNPGCQVVTFRRPYVPPAPGTQYVEPTPVENYEELIHVQDPEPEKPWWR